jgi:flagellar protein FlgJ
MIGVGTPLAADARGVESLRAAAARDPKAAIKEAAKQFEALFMHELMKSMRQATPTSGLSDDATTQLGTEMLDTQFAQQMTGLRGGLSEAIARHLERQLGIAPGAAGDVIAPAAQALQRGGDATDAHGADRLTRSINTTLRAQRAVG